MTVVTLLFALMIQSATFQGIAPPSTPRQILRAFIRNGNCPNGVKPRLEYRQMSESQWRAFHDSLLVLSRSPSPDGRSYSEMDWWTKVHLDNVPSAHL